jgi:RNA polymerase subunit RPABC4/transcription elongation factor Spt4
VKSTDSVKLELANDYGRGLCQCRQCKTFYFDSDKNCPACSAGLFLRCWASTEDGTPVATHENYAKAYEAKAAKLLRQVARYREQASLHLLAHAESKL